MRTFNLPVLFCATPESISAETTSYFTSVAHLCGSNPKKKLERKKTVQLIQKESNQMFVLQKL